MQTASRSVASTAENEGGTVRRATVAAVAAAVTAMLAAPGALAQQTLRGGINLSKFVGADAEGDENRRGLNAGGSFELINIGPVSIGPEIFYAEKGSLREADPLSDPLDPQQSAGLQTASFGLDYVEVPAIVKVHVPVSRVVGAYVEGGPAFAWNLDCGVELESAGDGTGGGSTLTEGCEGLLSGDAESVLADYDQGAAFGGGVNVRLFGGRTGINLDGRLTRGLARVTEEGNDLDIKNNAFALTLGFAFNLRPPPPAAGDFPGMDPRR